LWSTGDLVGAEAEYLEAIALDPTEAWAHNNLGVVLQDKGDLDRAIAAFKKAIEYEPSNASAQSNLRDALQEETRRKAEKSSTAPAQQLSCDRAAGAKLKIALPGGVVMRFAWCPPGAFRMGSNHPLWPRSKNDRPVHAVTLTKGFFLGIHPVTQGQWNAVMGTDPSHFKGPNRPVEQVSWYDCRRFCERLTARLGGRGAVRLPTEAEWEYACRAGTTSEYHFCDAIAPDRANYDDSLPRIGSAPEQGTVRGQTTDVGSFPANPWGLFDMHGNVWEWCSDWYGPYSPGAQTDPSGPKRGEVRVLRGGSWRTAPSACRSASRDGNAPGDRYSVDGFRVCLDPESSPAQATCPKCESVLEIANAITGQEVECGHCRTVFILR
jgi:formylglycine-generating enzyme required for sulfatase activity